MVNPIIEFYKNDGDLTSPEGHALIEQVDSETITEAAASGKDIWHQLNFSRNASDDVGLRAKIMSAIAKAIPDKES